MCGAVGKSLGPVQAVGARGRACSAHHFCNLHWQAGSLLYTSCPCKLTVEAQLPLQGDITSQVMGFEFVLCRKLCLLLQNSTTVMYAR